MAADSSAPLLPPALAALLPATDMFAPGAARGLPARPGAYLLACRLDSALSPRIPSLGAASLAPGWYLYAGSANGPGGIAARLGRHLGASGRRHWHIDAVTANAGARAGFAFPGGDECALVAALLASGAFSIPLPGFGSSDCRTCQSHLLRWVG